MKFKETLKSKLESIELYAMGNRVNLLGRLMTGIGVTDTIKGISYGSGMIYGEGEMGLILTSLGVFLEFVTLGGVTTPNYFKKTEKRIKRGELTQGRVEKLIRSTENNRFFGYCDVQGIYLAARKHKKLDVFKKAKKNVCNVRIPNF